MSSSCSLLANKYKVSRYTPLNTYMETQGCHQEEMGTACSTMHEITVAIQGMNLQCMLERLFKLSLL